jgi:hypothetical protein
MPRDGLAKSWRQPTDSGLKDQKGMAIPNHAAVPAIEMLMIEKTACFWSSGDAFRPAPARSQSGGCKSEDHLSTDRTLQLHALLLQPLRFTHAGLFV